jgi:hypothetical protein
MRQIPISGLSDSSHCARSSESAVYTGGHCTPVHAAVRAFGTAERPGPGPKAPLPPIHFMSDAADALEGPAVRKRERLLCVYVLYGRSGWAGKSKIIRSRFRRSDLRIISLS